jgi:hypothetical protein
VRVTADPETVAQLDDLDERHHQVADERVPAESIGPEIRVLGDVESGPIEDRPCRGRPLDSRIEQAADHHPDGIERPQLAGSDRLRWQRHPMVGQVSDGVRPIREVIVIALIAADPSEPVAPRSMTRVGDPEQVVDGSPWLQHDHAGFARTQAAHDEPRSP